MATTGNMGGSTVNQQQQQQRQERQRQSLVLQGSAATASPPRAEGEVALSQVLSKILTSHNLHDVALQGTDGVKVPANRTVLAARSEVLERLLLGGGDGRGGVVRLNYKSSILQALVEYIHTDNAELLNISKKRRHSQTTMGGDMNGHHLKMLVSLTAAANQFQLPSLAQKAEDRVTRLLDETPSLSFCLLDYCNSSPEKQSIATLVELARTRVRSCAKGNVSAQAVAGLSVSVLEDILQDDKIEMTELEVFEILRLWMEAEPTVRRSTAAELAKCHIRLERIDPRSLSNVVAASTLVSDEQLKEAYQKQALAFHDNKPINFQQRHHTPVVWQNTATKNTGAGSCVGWCIDLLKYPPMTSGVHQWTLELVQDGGTNVGIAATGCTLDLNNRLGDQQGGWAVTHTGYAWHANQKVGARTDSYGVGDKLTFLLDLRENNSGTLSWSTEYMETPDVIFTNLRHHLAEFCGGFVPAVSTQSPACFRLLEIKKLQD